MKYESNYLIHHGVKNQKWGVRNGPPYPLDKKYDSARKKAQKEALSYKDTFDYAAEMTDEEFMNTKGYDKLYESLLYNKYLDDEGTSDSSTKKENKLNKIKKLLKRNK